MWDPKREAEKQDAESQILSIHTKMEEKAEKANPIWRNTAELATIRLQKLATIQIQCQAKKHGALKKKVHQIW